MVMSGGRNLPGKPATSSSNYACPNDGGPVREVADGLIAVCPVCGKEFEIKDLEPRKSGRKRR
jgi:uncharacterized Zn finger protein (UPF0148 family)